MFGTAMSYVKPGSAAADTQTTSDARRLTESTNFDET